MLQYADVEAPVLALSDDTEMNFVTAQKRVAFYMVADKTHPSFGNKGARSQNNLASPASRHYVDTESYKFDYLSGDGFGFTVRIPGRRGQRSRSHDAIERLKRPPLQTFEEARSRSRRNEVTPACGFDLANERPEFPYVMPSHHGRFCENDFVEELGNMPRASQSKRSVLRRSKTSSFESDALGKRRDFMRTRSEHGMKVKVNEELTSHSPGCRPRNEHPMLEPSAPIPSYSHVSSLRTNYKQR